METLVETIRLLEQAIALLDNADELAAAAMLCLPMEFLLQRIDAIRNASG